LARAVRAEQQQDRRHQEMVAIRFLGTLLRQAAQADLGIKSTHPLLAAPAAGEAHGILALIPVALAFLGRATQGARARQTQVVRMLQAVAVVRALLV
jgi:hypothetical protein